MPGISTKILAISAEIPWAISVLVNNTLSLGISAEIPVFWSPVPGSVMNSTCSLVYSCHITATEVPAIVVEESMGVKEMMSGAVILET